jgi:probable rRNA maturation factor
MPIEVILGNHQDITPVPEHWLTVFESIGPDLVSSVLRHVTSGDAPLCHLGVIEIALVDEETSARVHRDFMDVDGSTDVITFHHGEIVICAKVAERNAGEYDEPLCRELFRYIVHGMLHLAGHEDESEEDRVRMEAAQEQVVRELWHSPLFEPLR